MLGMFPFGVLAHSHTWKAPGSQPVKNVKDAMWALDEKVAAIPRELLDMICVADLGTWRRLFLPYLGPHLTASHPQATELQRAEGMAVTALVDSAGYEREDGHQLAPPPAAAVFLTGLLQRLGHVDPTLAPLARALEITGTPGEGSGLQRTWGLGQVYSDDVRALLPSRIRTGDPLWNSHY